MLDSFYSTYEELKLLFIKYKCLFKFSFYSTYEELKHYCPGCNVAYCHGFLQYLWGIETW